MSLTLTLRSPSAAPLGTAVYTDNTVQVPAQFKPTLTFTAKENATGSNVNMTAKLVYPLATQVNGVWEAKSQFTATFSFNALQSVLNEAERAAVLETMAQFITDHKTKIAQGSVV